MGTEKDLDASMKAAKNSTARSNLAPPSNLSQSLSPGMVRKASRVTTVADEIADPVALKMGFLGAGQGGGRMAQAFWNLGYRRVGVFNTTPTDQAGLADAMPKFSLEVGGAQKDMQLAAQATANYGEDIRDLMTRAWGDDLDWALICVGLGGGTGSGMVSRLIKLARIYMEDKGKAPHVGVLLSLPRVDEGQQQARNTVQAFKELVAIQPSPIIIIDNAKIEEVYNPVYSQLYSTANSVAAGLFDIFNRQAAVHSEHVTFDRSEFVQLMGGGIVVFGTVSIDVADIKSPADVSGRIRDGLTNNVLATVDLTRGKKAACLVIAEQALMDQFPSSYFAAGATALDRIVGSSYAPGSVSTVIHSGIYTARPADGSGFQCFAMVSELEPPFSRLKELSRKGGLDGKVVSGLAQYFGVAD
jgi:cell division GTPase FtsZ